MNYIIEKVNLSEFIVCDFVGIGGYYIGSFFDFRMIYVVKMRGIKFKGLVCKF